jgi:hypothetical protein
VLRMDGWMYGLGTELTTQGFCDSRRDTCSLYTTPAIDCVPSVRCDSENDEENGTSHPFSCVVKSSASYNVGLEVVTAVAMKSFIFSDIISCSPLKINRRFGETCHLYL